MTYLNDYMFSQAKIQEQKVEINDKINVI